MTAFFEHNHTRYERKFVVEGKGRAYGEMLIKQNPANFHPIFQLRSINNIYFDTTRFKNYSDNFEGNSNRQKIRIRWYGNTFGYIKNPILEFKIKRGELGIKKSFPLPDFTLESGFNAFQFEKYFEQADLPTAILEIMKSQAPRLLNTYQRTYFRSFDHAFRFTVDDQLEYRSFRNQNNQFLEIIKDDNKIILELKYEQKFGNNAAFITNSLPLRLNKFSKYIAGLELLKSGFI
ncbi:MAG: VTC domain-containing protein [Bacteroidales bacterium]|nr:VTC domain-containing protein [Bacteroidales bacterium]